MVFSKTKGCTGMAGDFKHQYLIRLIATTLVFLYMPFLVYFGITLPRAYNEFVTTREEHFEELTRLFSLSFEKQVSEFYTTAMQLSVESRDSRSSSFILTSPLFNKNPYYYLECINAVAEFDRYRNLNPGIYFPQADCLFTRSFKYTAESYITDRLAVRDAGEADRISDFFRKTGGTINFFSTFPVMGEKGQLFLGIPVRLGLIREEALVFFAINQDAIDVSGLYSGPGKEGIQFLVYDAVSSDLLYSAGNFFPLNYTGVMDIVKTSRGFINEADIRYRLFDAKGSYGTSFISIMPFDRITAGVNAFMSAMTQISIAAGILILLFLGIMVYINYRPIDHLADEMSERNRLVLDLLLGNLLHGLPIPPREAEKLGLRGHSQTFAVITVFDYKFQSEERKTLSSGLFQMFSVVCYITDILYQDHSVIICSLPGVETKNLREYLNVKIPPDSFEIGSVVNSLEEVKDSYRACLEQRNKKDRNNNDEKKQAETFHSMQKAQNFRDSVLQYVEEQYNNPQLSQISVADHFGISIYSLSRLFNNDLGIGFAEFITAKRMEAARDLLLATNNEISEIARKVGFVNANYFSRLFKSNYGVIPSRYRIKIRHEQP